MAAAEHQRAGAIERLEQLEALIWQGGRQQRQTDEQNEERDQQAGARPAADRQRQLRVIAARLVLEQAPRR